jgi:hypothetical protein
MVKNEVQSKFTLYDQIILLRSVGGSIELTMNRKKRKNSDVLRPTAKQFTEAFQNKGLNYTKSFITCLLTCARKLDYPDCLEALKNLCLLEDKSTLMGSEVFHELPDKPEGI